MSENSYDARAELDVGGTTFTYYALDALQSKYDVARLPFSLKVLLENVAAQRGRGRRPQGGRRGASPRGTTAPSRARRSPSRPRAWCCRTSPACRRSSTSPRCATRSPTWAATRPRSSRSSPPSWSSTTPCRSTPSARRDSFAKNAELEFERNEERYQLLKWGQEAFEEFKVVPPDTGIVHQVNLEYLARVVFDNDGVLYPDTLVGTDSHTTMINGLGVLGWGVGGIEAEAAMLGQPMSMLLPQVIGFKLGGELPEGATATDLVLTVTEMLRKYGVVGKFVEFFGPGVARLALADRATLGNMSPEFGSTCAIFPIDAETIRYMRFSGPLGRAVRARRGLREGAGHVARRGLRGADVLGHRSSSTSATSSRRSPGRSARRTASRSPTSRTATRARARAGLGCGRARRGVRRSPSPRRTRRRTATATHEPSVTRRRRRGVGGARSRSRRRQRRPTLSPRRRRDRRDHLVHEHLEPERDGGRGAAGPQRASRRA